MRTLCIVLAAAALGGGTCYAIFDAASTMYLTSMFGRPRVGMQIEYFIAFIFAVSILSSLIAIFLNTRVAPAPFRTSADSSVGGTPAGPPDSGEIEARIARLEAALAERGHPHEHAHGSSPGPGHGSGASASSPPSGERSS